MYVDKTAFAYAHSRHYRVYRNMLPFSEHASGRQAVLDGRIHVRKSIRASLHVARHVSRQQSGILASPTRDCSECPCVHKGSGTTAATDLIAPDIRHRVRGFKLILGAIVVISCGSAFLAPSASASAVVDNIRATLPKNVPDWATVVMMAALPLVELRGAVPLGISVLAMDPVHAYTMAVLGNMIPVPLLLLGLGPISDALSKLPILKKAFDHIFARARKQGAAWKENEFWALALFVGVPLPGTGAWSGAIGAFVLDMPFWKAMLANFVGVLIAGALMTVLSLLGWKGFYIAAAVLLGAPLLAILSKLLRSQGTGTTK